jgi:hypothetical protein
VSENGYIDNELVYNWMVDFEAVTRPDIAEDWQLLAVDSYVMHISLEVLDYAWDHQVEMAG